MYSFHNIFPIGFLNSIHGKTLINVQANSVTHTPGGGDDISFRLVTSDGVAMSTIVSWKGGLPPIPFQDMNYPTTNKVHVQVINPLSGTNMASTGQFSGFYY